MITVVEALIKKNNKYLIARRSTGSEDVLGKWEFPGGKVESVKPEKQTHYNGELTDEIINDEKNTFNDFFNKYKSLSK